MVFSCPSLCNFFSGRVRQNTISDAFVYKVVRVSKWKSVVKMDTNEEMESSSSTDVVGQWLSTKTSTLALMTTSIVLFLTLVAKRFSSKQSEVRRSGKCGVSK